MRLLYGGSYDVRRSLGTAPQPLQNWCVQFLKMNVYPEIAFHSKITTDMVKFSGFNGPWLDLLEEANTLER